MALGLAEACVNSVRTYLTNNMPARLDQLEIEYADGITLDDPAVYFVGEQRFEELVERYPAFVIRADETTIEGWKANVSTLLQHVDAAHAVSIGAVVLDQDSERLRRRLYRYGRATLEVLIAGHSAGSLGQFQMVDEQIEMDFSPVETVESDYIGSFELRARFRKQETVGT